jgi:hypothetical protein
MEVNTTSLYDVKDFKDVTDFKDVKLIPTNLFSEFFWKIADVYRTFAFAFDKEGLILVLFN